MSMSLQSLEPIVVSTKPSKSKLRVLFDRMIAAREAEVMRRARVHLEASSHCTSRDAVATNTQSRKR